jgi:cystathionine beta-lyase
VLHPALPGAPGHEHWQSLCTQAAGLFSVVFDARIGAERVDAFVDALKLFRIGYSWGGPVSLVVPYDLAALRAKPRWQGTLVRFSVGLEAAEDLQADLEQALTASGLG